MPSLDVQRTLRDYVRILFRRKWLFLVPFVTAMVVAVALFFSGWWPEKYRATAQVLREDPVLLRELGRSTAAEKMAETLDIARARLTTRREIVRILCADAYGINDDRRLGLEPEDLKGDYGWNVFLNEADWSMLDKDPKKLRQWSEIVSDKRWNDIVEKVTRGISVRPRAQAREAGVQYITIHYTDENETRAVKICQAVTKTYVQGPETDIKRRFRDTIKTLEDQLILMQTKQLEPAKSELDKFRMEHLGNLRKDAYTLDQEKAERETAVSSLENQVQAAKNNIARLEEDLKSQQKEIEAQREYARNSRVLQIEDEIRQSRAELRQLRLRYTEEYPRIKEIQTLIDGWEREKASLPVEIEDRRTVTLNPTWVQLNQQLAARIEELARLEDNLHREREARDEFLGRVQEILDNHRTLTKLQKKFDDARAEEDRLEKQIEARKEELRTYTEKEGIQFHIVDHPLKPNRPFSPDLKTFLLFGLLAGLASGAGLVVVVEHSDRSLRSVSEAARYLRLPVVGTIGVIRTRGQQRRRMTFRVMRWSLLAVIVLGTAFGAWYAWTYHPDALKKFRKAPWAYTKNWIGIGPKTEDHPSAPGKQEGQM